MAAKRSEISKYDKLALRPENQPKNAREVKKNPQVSRVPYLFFDELGRQLCSAKCHDWTPEKPRYCGSNFVGANGRCKLHGGTIVPGAHNARFKTGKYSRSLPSRLAANYEAAQNDEELQTLTNELHLVDTRLQDLLAQTTAGGAAEFTKSVLDAWKSFNAAARSGDSGKIAEQKYRLDDAIKALANENGVWLQIEKTLDLRRKLVLAEGKRLQMVGATVPIEKVNVMIGFIITLISQQVHDRATARRLIGDVLKLTGRPDTQEIIPAASGTGVLDSGALAAHDAATDGDN